MAGARELYENRSKRAKELKGEGRKIIGYLCCYPPVEVVTAAGLVPYRVTGTLEPTIEADAYVEPLMCPFIRGCFELGIKGEYGFLDGMIWPHSCDNVQKGHDMWKYYIGSHYWRYLDVPHMTYPSSFEYFRFQISLLKETMEDFAQVKISDEDLNDAIRLHNQNRGLMRELCALRREDPPVVSGTEMTEVVLAVMTTPVEEANELVRGVIEEVKGRKERPAKKAARLLVYGSEIDDIAFPKLVEECEANVVIDDLCIGTRWYWEDVDITDDPLQSLAERYLGKTVCPRTHRSQLQLQDLQAKGLRKEELDLKFGYLRNFARDYNVNGAILYIMRYCDTHELDAPDVRDYLQEMGVPVLHLEDDYSLTSIGGLRTRIEAFLEMIG
jgi:bzd-type benzoyl-CoA reductase N subunit